MGEGAEPRCKGGKEWSGGCGSPREGLENQAENYRPQRIFETIPVGEIWAPDVPGEAQAPNYPTRQQMTCQEGSEVTWQEQQCSGNLYSNGFEQLLLFSVGFFISK